MTSLKIENVKEFMAVLFSGELFDRFQVVDCEIRTFCTMKLSGALQSEWENKEDDQLSKQEVHATWSRVRPYVMQWIKGKKPPLLLIVNLCHITKEGEICGMRIQYQGDELRVITTYSTPVFTLDKSGDQGWDQQCRTFFSSNQISFEEE